jgi:glucans biosynthesis protein
MHRRDFLSAGAALLAPGLGLSSLADAGPQAPEEPFDFARLKGLARGLAANAYAPPESTLPAALAALDYDAYQAIRFRPERALWADQSSNFRAEFFHRGFRIRNRVRIFELVDGRARAIDYDPKLFDFGRSGLRAASLSHDLGFAGLRLNFHTDWRNEVAVFLDASYFRARGEDNLQYGVSARGLAIDTGLPSGEEFPVFTSFWLERPPPGALAVVLYALLDSPSVAGAYRFEIAPGASLRMDVDCALYPRRAIQRLGLVPLTSMYLCGENDHRVGGDWRPEIHDSDGLSIATGAGEWLWWPLVNSPDIRVNSFVDEQPRGFGLLQRDRLFDHYQDDGVYYDQRPSAWVEPRGSFGRGAVQLMQMSAPDETVDNIVAWWNPHEPPQPGDELLCTYRLHWGRAAPLQPSLAQVTATRDGIGGVVGQPHQEFSWRFVVDFAGGGLAALARKAPVDALIHASRGRVELASTHALVDTGGWRAMFDLVPPDDDKREPIDLQLFLRLDGQRLSETWVNQYQPPPRVQRAGGSEQFG